MIHRIGHPDRHYSYSYYVMSRDCTGNNDCHNIMTDYSQCVLIILGPRNFRFWQYHLYPNSNISVNTCVLHQNRNTPEVIVYIVKGNSNTNNWPWGRSPDSAHAEVFRSVRAECLNATNITMSYNVLEEDEYYTFFYNPRRFSTSSYSTTLQFERFEYALPSHNETLLPSCTALPQQQQQCTVDIPYGTGSQLALV